LRIMEPQVRRAGDKIRTGRGFSLGELGKAGTHYREALKFGIPVDTRRKTVYKENIKAIRKFLAVKRKTVRAPAKNEEK